MDASRIAIRRHALGVEQQRLLTLVRQLESTDRPTRRAHLFEQIVRTKDLVSRMRVELDSLTGSGS